MFVRTERSDHPLLALGILVHLLAGVALVMMTVRYFGGGDLTSYYGAGIQIAELLSYDFWHYAGRVVEYTLGQSVPIPVHTPFMGTSSASTVGLVGWTLWVTQLRSLLGVAIVLSMLAFAGQWGIFVVLRRRFPLVNERLVGVCTLFIPSTTYWASGPTKEVFMVAGIGAIVWSLDRVARRDIRATTIFMLVIGLMFASLSKPYVLFPIGITASLHYYFSRQRKGGELRIRPVSLAASVALAIGVVAILGVAFPRFAYEQVGEEIATLQYHRGQGGSGYVMGDYTERTFAGQIAFAPIALLFIFFRPTIFEVHNVAMAASAIEIGVFVIIFVRLLFVAGVGRVVAWVLQDKNLLSLVIFVLIFGAAVGLSTTNFGTLSRYRAPMMPFYAMFLAALSARTRRSPGARSPLPTPDLNAIESSS